MPVTIDKETILKYDIAGPRYTSYPTAPEWSSDVSASIYERKLSVLGQTDKTVSLYIHIPFCEQLCYFCACNKVIRPNEAKHGDEYLHFLFKEIELVAGALGNRKRVVQLHWGGGTPTYLNEDQTRKLYGEITEHFDVDPNGEIAIEIDPRTVNLSKLKNLRTLGFNRVSLGIQDFDVKVQDDINRIQSYELVRQTMTWCRDLGFISVNFDLIYGLPYQTAETFRKTIDLVIGLRPDRIALYSFAYVPWLSKPQNKFNLEAIAQKDEKLDIFLNSRQALIGAGYDAIAMDHFALQSDAMARAFHEGTLYRNFMGYTLKPADEFIGMGVSAIGFIENAFFQNIKTLPEYYKALNAPQLPIERGKILSRDDQIRQWVIHSLMCTFRLNKNEFQNKFHTVFDQYFRDERIHIGNCLEDHLIIEKNDSLIVTELGKLFIRNVCMGFDWYLRKKNGLRRYSRTI